jgi:hypothetical protein
MRQPPCGDQQKQGQDSSDRAASVQQAPRAAPELTDRFATQRRGRERRLLRAPGPCRLDDPQQRPARADRGPKPVVFAGGIAR